MSVYTDVISLFDDRLKIIKISTLIKLCKWLLPIFHEKFKLYQNIGSLFHYIVLSCVVNYS